MHFSKVSKVILTVAVLLTIASMWVPGLRRRYGPREPHTIPCIVNLHQLQAAKEQWALEKHKATNEVPMWSDVNGYIRQGLTCPQGGTYKLRPVGELPKCSIDGPGHSIPEERRK